MMQSDMVDLSLKEMENLDSQFRKLVPAVVNSLKDEKTDGEHNHHYRF